MKTKVIYKNYEINELGEIRNLKTGRLLKQSLQQRVGYTRVHIAGKARYIHKLMAEAFMGKNEGEKYFVSHKDYDKTNNKLENLELKSSISEIIHKYKYDRAIGNWKDTITDKQREYWEKRNATEGYKRYQREYWGKRNHQF